MSSPYDLITLAYTKAHMRVTTTAGDTDLSGKITAASRAVVRYLDGGGSAFLNSSGQPDTDTADQPIDVPEDVQLATVMLVAEYGKNREAMQDGAIDAQFGYGYLPRPVVALLYPFRTPVIG